RAPRIVLRTHRSVEFGDRAPPSGQFKLPARHAPSLPVRSSFRRADLRHWRDRQGGDTRDPPLAAAELEPGRALLPLGGLLGQPDERVRGRDAVTVPVPGDTDDPRADLGQSLEPKAWAMRVDGQPGDDGG